MLLSIDVASVNVKRLAGRCMFPGLSSICHSVFMPETDSLKHPQQYYLSHCHSANFQNIPSISILHFIYNKVRMLDICEFEYWMELQV